MTPTDTLILPTLAIGIAATLLMDGWAMLRRRLLGMPSLDYAMVGRWVGHMPRGRFRHAAIGKAAAVTGERALGWLVHYLTGIVFALAFVMLAGESWLNRPTLAPALLFGLVTVAMPFLLMQPAFGLGIAAAKTAAPARARLHSLLTHAVFGLGLYLGAQALVALT
ncbi:DUF2938 domain-containing protein [Pseudomonas sp. ZM23]|uniref:DUF2938 domain-containing protein n=1 Tax=Pseudomonas triclosanedens TaxID=2961893 RepID=A0ABY6ZUE3_9PSED|nr:DUF2938 domain-containing protein [Pseudomonas triclosanedens]MCP8467049.1 DUF2938 domain-containing protein [Pseudomonas triclosanedens]MCP8472803.1 DUF2938 domain-containing protein [Pseudomonas triclosanedens]MCP8478234.1 DUF2938 domain-containing protein [Pseudomonas triclosanedens]WAI47640.1 DUF2938 domain-containing protein [Pseudomonas triclosanedens]